MRNYKSLHQRIEFHVLAEEATVHAFGDLREDIGAVLHGVPMDYTPKKAKFKARALEWFRISQKLQNDDWILHLDEETYVDNYGIRTCLDVIERSPDISIAQVGFVCPKFLQDLTIDISGHDILQLLQLLEELGHDMGRWSSSSR